MAHIVIDGRIINSSTGRYVERLVTYLQDVDKTNQYTVLVPSKDEHFWTPTVDNFTVKTADFANYSFAEQIGFRALLDKLQPDLVHFCMPQQPILYRGTVVTTFHDFTLLHTYMSDKNWLIYKTKQFVGRFAFRRAIAKSAHIITDTDYTKNEVIAFSKNAEGKTSTVLLAADVNKGAVERYPTEFKQFILYVGQQADFKNVPRLAAAHQRLIKKYPDLGLILVGRKDKPALQNEASFTEKGYKNIVFTDFIPDTQRDWLYEHAAAYVFPSLMEGFGLPGLEAMGYGTPVISSNATCLPEVYEDAAVYFDPTDTTDVARAIDEVLSDDHLRSDLIKKGFLQIKKYSWHKTAEQTHAIYMNALASATNLPEQS